MVNKFLIAIIAVVAVMAALVFLPGIASQNTELRLNYLREHISRTESGLLDSTTREILVIENDGVATHTRTESYPTPKTNERKFSLSSDEVKKLKALIFETGFMEIPVSRYDEKEGLSNYTRYQIAVYEGDSPKTIMWFNPEASKATVPSLITNIGSQLDTIIERHS